ncbi:uncharacterized protein MAM_00038 [Metarhizium album ARSEF 1941]|uniref:FAR1 domain-containing protein n=1 Tax=Metarhizium album (strain ARSEF 1941) TaxID=1081103 RepID=A0A0B2WXL8_METAS|nr:uncharacterized protein MAM_00038 [Metarhizium album ARSEF 1941]KHO01037.1 hypothetical protein MAM_00038 [Metarhizium album ARSEF 1941]
MAAEAPPSPCNPPPNLPPSPGYSSFDDLYNAVQAFGRKNGIAFTKGSISNNREINGVVQPTWGILDCDRGGRQKPPRGAGIRRTSSRKTGCTYRLKVSSSSSSGRWEWHYQELGSHNHDRSSDPSRHAIHRRFTESQKRRIMSLTRHTSLRPRSISTVMREEEDEELYFRQKDIYNQRQRARQFQPCPARRC